MFGRAGRGLRKKKKKEERRRRVVVEEYKERTRDERE